MKLAILLTTGLESQDRHTVKRLAGAARRLGHEVSLFLMDDGVYCVGELRDLLEVGVEMAVCAHNCLQRGVGKVEGVLFGGQNDWADMVNKADRVVVFG